MTLAVEPSALSPCEASEWAECAAGGTGEKKRREGRGRKNMRDGKSTTVGYDLRIVAEKEYK